MPAFPNHNASNGIPNTPGPRAVESFSRTPTYVNGDAPPPLAYSLVADAGTFVETGSAAGEFKTWLLAAAAAVFLVTGNSAAPVRGVRTTANAGAFVLTGQAATEQRTARSTATAGAFTLTGPAAAPVMGHRTTAATGVFILAGQGTPLTVLAADAGAFALDGNAAIETWSGEPVAPPSGGGRPYPFRVPEPDVLRHFTLKAATGRYAVRGQAAAPVYRHHYTIAAHGAAYAVAGHAATARVTYRLAAAPGTFAVIGPPATAFRGMFATRALRLVGHGGTFAVAGVVAEAVRDVTIDRAWVALQRAHETDDDELLMCL